MHKTTIIAEAGVNHNGDPDLALALVDTAAAAGADVVKFQSFLPAALVSHRAPMAQYQRRTAGEHKSQLAMLQRLALDETAHRRLMERCRQHNIAFLSSPFDSESAILLTRRLGLRRIKLGSGELTNGPLLLQIARTGADVILSTGMADIEEIRDALQVLAFGFTRAEGIPGNGDFQAAFDNDAGRRALEDHVTLLHCTTEYPCPYDEVNLRAMDTLSKAFGLPVGLSDHTMGYAVAVAAAARGARVIEKHFTLDRNLPGPDHQASLLPDELTAMVAAIRQVEASLGRAEKEPGPSERRNMEPARKSLVAARGIRAGEPFDEHNLTAKRPGGGLSPMQYWDLLGRPAHKDFVEDEEISPWNDPS